MHRQDATPVRTPRIGVFGGTFDPIHVGHLVAAVNARHTLSLNRVLLVVANEPWQKTGARSVTGARDRLAVVEAAVEGVDGLEASAIEIARGGPSYTADTLETLRHDEPDAEIFVIVGADVVSGIPTWQRFEEVRDHSTLVVVNRPHAPEVHLEDKALAGFHAVVIVVPALEISSTDLRERAATGAPLDYLVPAAAIRVIKDRSLYALER